MKNLLFIAFILVGIHGISQRSFTISGVAQYDAYHAGGMYSEYIPNPQPLIGMSFLLIRFNEGDSIPEVVKTFKTDEKGRFSLKVKPGKYGFAVTTDSLVANQYVPTGQQSGPDEWINTSSITWSLLHEGTYGPLVVTNADVIGAVLQRFSSSVCMMCP